MKNLISLLIFTFALLIMSNVDSKAQCPSCSSPYTSQSATYVYNSSCSITINFCLDCNPLGHPFMKLCSITIPTNNCDSVIVDETFWDNIRDVMLIEAVTVCGNTSPCPQKVAIEIYQAQCWKLENDWENQMVHVVSCDEEPGECKREYEVCFSGGSVTIYPGTATVTEEGECSEESIIVAPYPYNLFMGCFNSCY